MWVLWTGGLFYRFLKFLVWSILFQIIAQFYCPHVSKLKVIRSRDFLLTSGGYWKFCVRKRCVKDRRLAVAQFPTVLKLLGLTYKIGLDF